MNIALQTRAILTHHEFGTAARAWQAHLAAMAGAGAVLAVCAEDAWTALLPARATPTRDALDRLQAVRGDWLMLFLRIARATGMHIIAGGFPVPAGDGRFRLRCDLFHPCGRRQWQDRLHLSPEEEATGLWTTGGDLNVFDAAGLRIGIAAGQDVLYPLPVRAQCQAGAALIVAPVPLADPGAMARLNIAHQARAIENTCMVAATVPHGRVPFSDPLARAEDMGGHAMSNASGCIVHIDPDRDAGERERCRQQQQRNWSSQYFPAVRQPRWRPAAAALPVG